MCHDRERVEALSDQGRVVGGRRAAVWPYSSSTKRVEAAGGFVRSASTFFDFATESFSLSSQCAALSQFESCVHSHIDGASSESKSECDSQAHASERDWLETEKRAGGRESGFSR